MRETKLQVERFDAVHVWLLGRVALVVYIQGIEYWGLPAIPYIPGGRLDIPSGLLSPAVH